MGTKSPNLEVVSETKSSAEQERRRLPRLNLTGEQFRLAQNGKVFSVTDLSNEGMALRVLEREDLVLFPIAMKIAGTLNIQGYKIPVRAQVRHLGADRVGCQFEEISAELRAALDRFLDPAELGRELRPIPASDLGTLWYRGPSGTNLMLWRGTDGQYRRLALFVLGSFIQWDLLSGVSTGRVDISDDQAGEVRGIVRFDTMLLDSDRQPDAGKLNIAKTLLLSSNLPQDLKKWCVRQLAVSS